MNIIKNLFQKAEKTKITKNSDFGSCCKDLKEAMTTPPNSFFRVEESGVFYLTIGYVDTEDGPGFFDQAVMFCPFCSTKLQTREEIKNSTKDI